MWIHVPSPPFPSAPASEVSNWASDSFCRDCASLLTVSGTLRQPRYWRRVWQTARSTPRPFGAMSPRSTEPDGLEAWISSWAECLANRSAWPASDEDRRTSDGYGPTSGAGFGRFDRDSCIWRTCPDLFGMDFPLSSKTWPKRGSLRNGTVFQRPNSGRPTNGNGSLCWPTATVNGNYNRKGLTATSGGGVPDTLTVAMRLWPTPDAQAMERYNTSPGPAGKRPTLALAVKMWPTPTANDSKNDNPPSQQERNTPPLNVAAAMWQTPTVRGGGQQCELIPHKGHYLRPSGKKATVYLEQQAVMWATPRSSLNENRATRLYGTNTGVKHAEGLASQAGSFRPDRGIVRDGENGSPLADRPRLNPRFVETLMGLPVGWVSCSPLAMASYRSWLATHSRHLRGVLGWMCTASDEPLSPVLRDSGASEGVVRGE